MGATFVFDDRKPCSNCLQFFTYLPRSEHHRILKDSCRQICSQDHCTYRYYNMDRWHIHQYLKNRQETQFRSCLYRNFQIRVPHFLAKPTPRLYKPRCCGASFPMPLFEKARYNISSLTMFIWTDLFHNALLEIRERRNTDSHLVHRLPSIVHRSCTDYWNMESEGFNTQRAA